MAIRQGNNISKMGMFQGVLFLDPAFAGDHMKLLKQGHGLLCMQLSEYASFTFPLQFRKPFYTLHPQSQTRTSECRCSSTFGPEIRRLLLIL